MTQQQIENNQEKLENLCIQRMIAINQRSTELSRGQGLAGTYGYENAGCYECEGDRISCPSFFTIN